MSSGCFDKCKLLTVLSVKSFCCWQDNPSWREQRLSCFLGGGELFKPALRNHTETIQVRTKADGAAVVWCNSCSTVIEDLTAELEVKQNEMLRATCD